MCCNDRLNNRHKGSRTHWLLALGNELGNYFKRWKSKNLEKSRQLNQPFLTMYPLRKFTSNTTPDSKDVLDVEIGSRPKGPEQNFSKTAKTVLFIRTNFISEQPITAVVRFGIYNEIEREVRPLDTKLSFGHNQELIVVRVEIPTLRQRGDKEYRVHVMLFEADELVAEQESIEVLDAWCK